ncbi:MAG: PDZ domain-containing protein [Chlamydiia bacterium]|nr:PDZ domain-containing protein [Chlamydiia bacterium]
MRRFSLLSVLLSIAFVAGSPLCAESQDTLGPDDVKSVMRKIFEYHVDQKRMTPELMQRSLSIYIDHADPDRLYLLKSEVEPYRHPSSALIDRAMNEYNRGEVTVFHELDDVIRKAVLRSRKYRDSIELNSSDLFAEKKELQDPPRYPKPDFAASEQELQQRIRNRLLRFIQSQRKAQEDKDLTGQEKQALALYERNVRGPEDEYLDVTEEGKALTAQEAEHQRSIRVLKAMAKSLDSHTAFFSAQEAYDMRVRLEKGFHGIGIVLQESIDGIVIVRLIDNGPAARSGLLKKNDRVVEVDGVNVREYSFDKVLDMIRGQEGAPITLGIIRGDDPKVVNVELQRERITMDDSRVDVNFKEVDGGIVGMLTLHSFYDGDNGINSERDIRNGIRELYQKGNLKGLILDLRDNTGGFLMQAVKVAGLFITNGVVVISKYADGEMRYFRDIDGHAYYDGPLVILTSKASASAAEIVAQTLQDYGAALIVGDERTYGKGSIQHQTVTGQGSDSFFKVTVGRYYTVSGKSTQIEGVRADIVVPSQFSSEQIGEKWLDYPLATGAVDPAYDDKLSDIDPAAKRWYMKYYMPSLQQRKLQYRAILPVLKQRSAARLKDNKRYQAYLSFAEGNDPKGSEEEAVFDELSKNPENVDPPMDEAVDIMKDMIMLLPNTGSMDKMFKE